MIKIDREAVTRERIKKKMRIKKRKSRAIVGHSDIPCVKRTKRLTNNRKNTNAFSKGGLKGPAGTKTSERKENGKNKAGNETEDGNGNGKRELNGKGGGILEKGKKERSYVQQERD